MAPKSRVLYVDINYGASFADMLTAGGYDDIHMMSVTLFSRLRHRVSGVVALHLLFFDAPPLVTNGDLFRELERLRKRAAETAELLALGARYPQLQREFPIAAYGSVGSGFNGGHGRFPCLDEYQGKRRFGPIWDDPDARWKFGKGCILAVPE